MDATTIRLSQEELLFILRSIGERSIPGMGVARLPEVDDATRDALTQAGGRALLARGLLTAGEDRLTLDSSLYAVAVACAHPDQMVSLAVTGVDLPPRQLYFYRVPELHVRHTPEAFGTHMFVMERDGDMGASEVAALLAAVPGREGSSAPYSLPQEALALAEERARGGARAEAILAEAGVAPADAASLAQAIGELQLNLIVQLIGRLQPVVEQVVFRVVVGAQDAWLVRGDSVEAERLTAQRLPVERIAALLAERFASLRALPPPKEAGQ